MYSEELLPEGVVVMTLNGRRLLAHPLRTPPPENGYSYPPPHSGHRYSQTMLCISVLPDQSHSLGELISLYVFLYNDCGVLTGIYGLKKTA